MDQAVGGGPSPLPTHHPARLEPSKATVEGAPPSSPSPAPAGLPISGKCQDTWGAGNDAPLTFAQALLKARQPLAIPVQVHAPATTDRGEPAVFFSAEEIKLSCQAFALAVIVKTPKGRPPHEEIRKHLIQRLKLQEDFMICALDGRHLLIRFTSREDYLKALLKNTMLVQGRPFRFAKWTPDFSPTKDSPVVPVWVLLPGLAANYYAEPMLRSIAGSIGPVLQLGHTTAKMTRADAAVVCVQLDVSKSLPSRVWIGAGAGGGWQPIQYPALPLYCLACSRLGHCQEHCRLANPAQTKTAAPGSSAVHPQQSAPRAPTAAGDGMRSVVKKQWRPMPSTDVYAAPSGSKQSPTLPPEGAQGNAHQLLDELPTQLPTAEPVKDLALGVQGDSLHPPLATTQPDCFFGDHANPSAFASIGGAHSGAQTEATTMAPPSLAAVQVFDEMPQPAAPDTKAAAVKATHTSDPPDNGGQSQPPPPPDNLLNKLAAGEGQQSSTSAHVDTLPPDDTKAFDEMPHPAAQQTAATPAPAVPSEAMQHLGAPLADKARVIPPSLLKVAAPPWTTPQGAEQPTPISEPAPTTPGAKGAACSPSGVETSASPSAPRLSFMEALKKKAKQRPTGKKPANHPPVLRPIVPPVQPGSKGAPDGHVICLPAPNTVGGTPVVASSSDSDDDDRPNIHNAWAGRTRGTTVLSMFSDEEYEDYSESDLMM